MRRSIRLGRLLIVAAIAVWLGLPPSLVRAQSRKAVPDSGAGGTAPVDGKFMPQVSILRLQVVKPDPGPLDMPAGIRRMRRINGFDSTPEEGTTLTLLIEEPQQWILSLEAKDCKITKFRDDRNTDLTLDKVPGEGDNFAFNPRPGPENCTLVGEVDPTGHRATVTVHSPHFPASGANRLSLEADLVIKFGHGERKVEQKNVNLKGDTIRVGPSPLVVMSQDPSDGAGQQNGTQVTLFHHGPIQREIKKVAFIGPDDAEIQTRAGGGGSTGSIHLLHYTFAQKVETCTVRLTVPETVETVTFSVAIDTGVGFPPGARRRSLKTPEPQGATIGVAPR
jgi:hypothetical protein